MSEIIYVAGDLTGVPAPMAEYLTARVDRKSVGKLTKHIGPLQAPLTVKRALDDVLLVAASGGEVIVDEALGTVRVRAVVTDHSCTTSPRLWSAPFAWREREGPEGRCGSFEGETDQPGFGHVLEVDGTGAAIRALKKAELKGLAQHPARGDLARLEDALMASPPPPEEPGLPRQFHEVPLAHRPLYTAVWRALKAAPDGALEDAAARELSWVAPDRTPDPDLVKLRDAGSGEALLATIAAGDPGRHRGRLDVMFRLLARLSPEVSLPILAGAPDLAILGTAIPGLLATGNAQAMARAEQLFDAISAGDQCELDHWYHHAGVPHAFAEAPIETSELVARLERAVATSKRSPSRVRAIGHALALTLRGGDEAHAAVGRAIDGLTGVTKECVAAYAPRFGWTPR